MCSSRRGSILLVFIGFGLFSCHNGVISFSLRSVGFMCKESFSAVITGVTLLFPQVPLFIVQRSELSCPTGNGIFLSQALFCLPKSTSANKYLLTFHRDHALVTFWVLSPFTLSFCLLSTSSKLMSTNFHLHLSVDFKIVHYNWLSHHFIFYLPSLSVSFQTHIWPRIELTLPAPFHQLPTGSPVDLRPNGVSERALAAGI